MIAMHKILGKTVVEIKVDGEGAITNAKMNDHLLRQSINVTRLSRNYWLATNFSHMFIHVAHSYPTILQCHHIDFLLISDYYPECPCSLVV